MKQEGWARAIERRIKEGRQQSQDPINWFDAGINRAQRLIQARELAGIDGFVTQLIETIDVREVEDGIEHKCAQREQNVSHGCGRAVVLVCIE